MPATNKRHSIDAAEIARLYDQQGWTIARLAAHYDLAQTTIRRRLAEIGIPARTRGPAAEWPSSIMNGQIAWTPAVAYAIGVIATDGNLARDGRHLSVTSKDLDMLETLRQCLGLTNAITPNISGSGRKYYRLQWGSRRFIASLLALGLTPAKSLTLRPLTIPDSCFADFLRGCIDGDGSILTYVDRYHAHANAKYVYQRLAVCLVSASPTFLEGIRDTNERLFGVTGALIKQPQPDGRATQWLLKYGKRAALVLLREIYYAPDLPCLARKRAKAIAFIHDTP